jgi:hypothetical protein
MNEEVKSLCDSKIWLIKILVLINLLVQIKLDLKVKKEKCRIGEGGGRVGKGPKSKTSCLNVPVLN